MIKDALIEDLTKRLPRIMWLIGIGILTLFIVGVFIGANL